MRKALLSMIFIFSFGLAGSVLATEQGTTKMMTFEELDADGDGTISAAEAEVHPPLRDHMESADMEGMDKMAFEEWAGKTSH
jgi:hypothetical protein